MNLIKRETLLLLEDTNLSQESPTVSQELAPLDLAKKVVAKRGPIPIKSTLILQDS
jgi:hypothetical protein